MQQYELEEVNKEEKIAINSSCQIYEQMSDIKHWTKEVLVAFYLDTRNGLISREIISVGTLDHAVIHPREVFRTGIIRNAASIVVAHNHPSGNLMPSSEDIDVTAKLKEAGNLIGIDLLDHVIVTRNGYHSLRDNGAV